MLPLNRDAKYAIKTSSMRDNCYASCWCIFSSPTKTGHVAAYLERVSVEPRVGEIELDVDLMMNVESVDKTCVIWICDCTRDGAAYVSLEGIKPP